MRDFIDRIQELWCAAMHDRALWPIHGKYRCATCLREYPVPFADFRDEPRPRRALRPAPEPWQPSWSRSPR